MKANGEMESAAALLDLWERGEARSPLGRGAALLGASCPGIAPELLTALPLGQREERLLALRERLFGPVVTGLVRCAQCGARVEIEFDSRELRSPDAPQDGEFNLDVGGLRLRCRLPSSADLEAVASVDDVEAVRAALFARCVVARDVGGDVVPATSLGPEVVAAVVDEMDRRDPLADIRLPVECPSCTHAWQAPFDVQSFLWRELGAWARRTLREVHALASAYGWSEAEILRLSVVRRRRYLELVAE